MNPFGFTRSVIKRNHALVTPESHVAAALPGWQKAQGIIVISPRLGADFSQYFVHMEAGASSGAPLPGVERFVFVEEGRLHVSCGELDAALDVGGYAYLPADVSHLLQSEQPTRLTVFERRYVPLLGVPAPGPLVGNENDVVAEAFMGDDAAMLKTLLPTVPAFDMAVNLFTFAPGAALPLVEVHVMEHGLLLLQGRGIYRLDDAWYPVQAGDVIWMAPYCPQWFTAVGKEPARYLYYKDVGRDALCD
ncbi:MAG: (S)-ureidoglycine aminohydrolase [Caldilineaceae bacterium]